MADLTGREVNADVVESCRLGDRDAFRALYLLYKDRVYSVALYFSGEGHENYFYYYLSGVIALSLLVYATMADTKKNSLID